MQKNKKKGVAILSAIILMTIVISISGLLFALITSSNLKNKIQKNRFEKYMITQKIFSDFVDNGIIDGEYNLNIELLDNSNDTKTGIQGVVAKLINSNFKTDLYYYCVYDFDNNKILAEQSDNFYITIKTIDNVNYYYLADLIRYKEV